MRIEIQPSTGSSKSPPYIKPRSNIFSTFKIKLYRLQKWNQNRISELFIPTSTMAHFIAAGAHSMSFVFAKELPISVLSKQGWPIFCRNGTDNKMLRLWSKGNIHSEKRCRPGNFLLHFSYSSRNIRAAAMGFQHSDYVQYRSRWGFCHNQFCWTAIFILFCWLGGQSAKVRFSCSRISIRFSSCRVRLFASFRDASAHNIHLFNFVYLRIFSLIIYCFKSFVVIFFRLGILSCPFPPSS